MLDKERNRSTSYRVFIHGDCADSVFGTGDTMSCSITIYPQIVSHHAYNEVKKSSTITGVFRYDALPQWMTDSIKMLDAAAVDGAADIPDFGVLSKDVYWFIADQTK